ncbi:ComEA family DNA-binding protein [Flavihumibacter stibioxidans]|uniref:Helix-hairpin-helix domain-containing protein n=1 Tax=Flavihumibacter stibioxidans TaxID=1834163 RepID=A0ABR7M755_9BACT|nr:helix-hairpin-helix domain-containing protein [Flavihumibacter stibioxidans]MBC6490845.1 hypothetical protein [Flavihumibacter stibioxidans]
MKSGKWKSDVADYFSFSKSERWGVLVLIAIVLILFIAPDYLPDQPAPVEVPDSMVSRLLSDWEKSDSVYSRRFGNDRSSGSIRSDRYSSSGGYQPDGKVFDAEGAHPARTEVKRFYFDPNTIGEEEMRGLGIPAKTAATISKYRSKGGRFRIPEDLQKIYSLPPALANELIPWVRIAADNPVAKGGNSSNESKSVVPGREQLPGVIHAGKSREVNISRIVMNQADSMAWLALPGIGPRLAGRIIAFREKLGGFYSASQVSEVYGLADSVFQKILPMLDPGDGGIRQLDINTATKEELAAHPYIRWQLATAIIQYRQAHGPFGAVTDLLKIHLISDEQFRKMAPYCKIR